MQIRLLSNTLVLCLIVVSMLVVVTKVLSSPSDDRTLVQQTSPCANADESGLPLPSSFLPSRLSEFQAQLKSFLSVGENIARSSGVKTRNCATPDRLLTASATVFIPLSKSITRRR